MVHSQLAGPLVLLCSLLMLPSVLMQEVGVPGDVFPLPVTDEELQQAATFAVEQYNQCNYNSSFYFKELRIVKAEGQLVEGMKYFLQMEVVKTVCEKSNGPLPFREIQKCELPPMNQQEKLICYFDVWSRPWENITQLSRSSCSPPQTNTGKAS